MPNFQRFLRPILFLVISTTICISQLPTVRQVPLPMMADSSFEGRIWQHNRLILYRKVADGITPAVAIFDKDGQLSQEFRLRIVNARDYRIRTAGVTPDGRVVVTGGASDVDGRVGNFIAFARSGEELYPRIRTNPFVPTQICATTDTSVWAFGWERSAVKWDKEADSYPILREFSFDGPMLTSIIDRAAIPSKNLARYPAELALRCKGNKVVLFVGVTGQLFSYDISTKSLQSFTFPKFPISTQITGLDLSETGDIFATVTDRRADSSLLYKLKISASSAIWDPHDVEFEQPKNRRLLGIDRNELVLYDSGTKSAAWKASRR